MSFKIRKFSFITSILGLLLAACGSAPSQSWPGVTVSEENATMYIADNTHLYAISTDGKNTLRWQQPSSNSSGGFLGLFGGGDSSGSNTSVNLSPVFAEPAVAGNLLVVTSYNKSVYGLDISDGTQKWVFSQSADRFIAPAVVHSDTIYAASADNTLYALDLVGNLKWKFMTEASLWSAPLPTDEVVYLPSMDHNLYAINVDGSQKWKQELNGALAGSPVLSEDGKTLYIGTLNDTLYALDAATGLERWTVATHGWVWTTPVVADGIVYFGDLKGTIFAVDALEGSTQWTFEAGGAVRSTPVVSGDTLMVMIDGGTVYGLNTVDGTPKWEPHVIDEKNSDRLLSNPVVVGDNLIILPMTAEKLIYALKIADGTEAWTYNKP